MLTQAQVDSNRKAIHSYIINQTKLNGGVKNSPVILLPEFEMDTDGEWYPVESNGVRPTKKEDLAFIRLGMAYVKVSGNGTPEVAFHTTNTFNDEKKLTDLIDLYDVKIGDSMPNCKLVVEESLTPFRKKNPEQDLKVAGASKIVCQGVDPTTAEVKPIYRRIKWGTTDSKDTLIDHVNKEEISKYASAEWARLNSPKPTEAIQQVGAKRTAKVN
jgi:hypothetical protein